MASRDCAHQQGAGMPDSLRCLQSPQILFGTPLPEMLPPPCELLLRSGMPHRSCWGAACRGTLPLPQCPEAVLQPPLIDFCMLPAPTSAKSTEPGRKSELTIYLTPKCLAEPSLSRAGHWTV